MNYGTGDHHLYAVPAAAPPYHHLHPPGVPPNQYQAPPAQSYPAYYNPNPNPVPGVPGQDNPAPSAVAADPGVYAGSYMPDPYIQQAGNQGFHAAGYAYPDGAAAAAYAYPQVDAVTAAYYQGVSGGGEGQWPVNPTGYVAPEEKMKLKEDIHELQQHLSERSKKLDEVLHHYYKQVGRAGIGSTSSHMMKGGGKEATIVDLETKKRKLIEGGTTADSMRVCAACNVVCNSDAVFSSHLAGVKHALKVLGKSSNGAISLMGVPPAHMKLQRASNYTRKGSKKIPKVVQSVHCEVCKIECNSADILSNHKKGKKHKKNLQKLQESIAPKPANNPTPATGEGLMSKKQKILDAGAAAESVRVCDVCNIVCNSQTVFDSHVSGHKHIVTVKKQQQQQQQQPVPAI